MENPSLFPVARTKRVMKEDRSVGSISNDTAVVVSLAAEKFIHYLVSSAVEFTKIDDRKTLSYKDVATAVKEIEQLEFLSDIIPMTSPYHDAVLRKKEVEVEQYT